MVDFRLVMPVTTASGKVAGIAGVGLAAALGDAAALWLASGEDEAPEGVAVGVWLLHAASTIITIRAAMPRRGARFITGRLVGREGPLDRRIGAPHRIRGLHRAMRAVAAAVLAGSVLTVMAPYAASPVAAVGPLPKCRLADILTVPRDYDSWSTTLVDWLLKVPRSYRPPDLVPVGQAGIAGPGLIRAVAIDDLRAMTRAAARNGTPIAVNSPYRSYAEQVASFNGWVGVDGYDDAITYSQRPGHSEHQLGLTIDFMTLNGGSALDGDWATTPSGAWMAANAWKYGWVMSYPKGPGGALLSDATCFHYEPWHYRYVGRDIARKVHESGLTIREYLWTHYTLVDAKTGKSLSTPSPTPSPTQDATPTPLATPTASATTTSPAPSTGPAKESDDGGLPISLPLAGGLVVVALAAVAVVAAGRRPTTP
jgi:D-alanyl-D-alanine carboxypeptidase